MLAPPSSIASKSASIVVRCSRDSLMNSPSSSSSKFTLTSLSMMDLLLRSCANVEACRQAHALEQAEDVGADVSDTNLAPAGSETVGCGDQQAHAGGVKHRGARQVEHQFVRTLVHHFLEIGLQSRHHDRSQVALELYRTLLVLLFNNVSCHLRIFLSRSFRLADPECDLVPAAIEPDALGIQRAELQPAAGRLGCFQRPLTRLSPGKPRTFVAYLQVD